MAWPAIKRGFTQEQFRAYLADYRFGPWRPSLIVWHNTAAPTLAQWHATAEQDKDKGLAPGTTRIANLERYFRNDRGWSGAPHFFIADDLIWVFNPLDKPGVHSPSWNSRSIGIEMVADFDREDDDSGAGLKVRNNTIFVTAVLCEAFGLDPHAAIKLHREDPKTTHACPGKDFADDKTEAVNAVAALLAGGEHSEHDLAVGIGIQSPAPVPVPRKGLTTADDLNVRSGPGASNRAIASLPIRSALVILDNAKNSTTDWLKVRTPNEAVGWVAGRFVSIQN